MIIDGLQPDRRRPGSTRILVGGKPAWTVPADVVKSLGLTVGGAIDADTTMKIELAADEEGAVRSAIRMLERRSHGRRELGRKLGRKGHSDHAVEATLDRLDRLGLIDDKTFAVSYVTARAGRGLGPSRLRRDLSGLGVDPDSIAAALSALADPAMPDPWERTLAQATRRAQSNRELPRLTRVRRLTAFFARRGFGGREASEAINRLVASPEGH